MKKLILKTLFIFTTFATLSFALDSFIVKNVYAQPTGVPNMGQSDKVVKELSDMDKGRGIIPCGTSPLDNNTPYKPCTPKDLFRLGGTLIKIFFYLIIIAIGLGGIAIGAMYPFYGDNAGWLDKMKRRIKNMVWAIVIAAVASSLIFALLGYVADNNPKAKNILDAIKSGLSYKDSTNNTNVSGIVLSNISLIQVASAQSSNGQSLTQVISNESVSTDGRYINFFGTDKPIELIHNLIKFLVVYIFVPMLILAVIWTGFLFVKAQGNTQEIEKAKKWAFRSVVGILVAASATFISDMFFESVKVLLNSK